MALFVQCEVVGCDETAPVDSASTTFLPPGWSNVVTAASEIEGLKIKKAIREADLSDEMPSIAMFGRMARGLMTKKVCCPKHPLPNFKSEPVSGGDE